jgi:hypothetical protein
LPFVIPEDKHSTCNIQLRTFNEGPRREARTLSVERSMLNVECFRISQGFTSCAGGLALALALILSSTLRGAEILSTNAPKFLGAESCGSSGCHGGGGQSQNQYIVWSTRDFHSQRPFATLTTARSKQIADALQIKDPTADSRCTSCHAPLHDMPEPLRGETFRASEGVSCESCHAPAENWLRAHTRNDWRPADRVFAGMRDLKNLYVRANTCVACHQTVPVPLQKAGHPELIFELDGQCVSQPRHWRERAETSGAQVWLTGQAAALREMSWQLSRESGPDEKLIARWSALLWLLQKLDGMNNGFPLLAKISAEPSSHNLRAAWQAGDDLARSAALGVWTIEMSRTALNRLAATGGDFRQEEVARLVQARRAERLVLALERLLLACGNVQPGSPTDENLNRLFQMSQSIPDFDSMRFAGALEQFSGAIQP